MRVECVMQNYDGRVSMLALLFAQSVLEEEMEQQIMALHLFEEIVAEAREMLEGAFR